MSPEEKEALERTLTTGTWIVVAGMVLYSVLTVTPLVREHSTPGWEWTAPLLPLVGDTAVIVVTRMDAALARAGERGGGWALILRWLTGLSTLALNTGYSALHRDWVGMGVHAVAPLILIVMSEAGRGYRLALARIHIREQEREQAEREARERAERERERREREEREAERDRAERRDREAREHAERLAAQAREHELAVLREQSRVAREHEREAREREAREREQQREAREREARERAEQEARRRAEREARERAERERQERVERQARERAEQEERQREALRQWLLGLPDADQRLPEEQARDLIVKAWTVDLPVRAASRITGWSVGWVTARYQELRDRHESGAAVFELEPTG
ncbi:hypothetical protein GCM10027168_00790 [Streptomyces capparidis]